MATTTGNVIHPARPHLSASKEALLRKRVQGAFKTLNHESQIPARAPSGTAPLSFAQQRLWFLQQLEIDSPAYNVPTALRLKGSLDLRAFEQAITQIHQRHAVLRATFPARDGTPVQNIAAPADVRCEVVDLQHLSGTERDRAEAEVLQERARKPFDLVHGPLTRYTLIRYAADEHVFVMVMHHIITDGWSVGLFLRELETLYGCLTRGEPAQLAPVPIQYSDFSFWQHETSRGDALQNELKYWKKKLAGAPQTIDLPTDHERMAAGGRGASRTIQFSSHFYKTLTAKSRARGATEFMMLVAALAVTLNRWSGQADLVLGTVAAGRTRREIENLLGCFMNFLPLRVQVQAEATGLQLLTAIKTSVLEAHSHQDCPFEKIVEAINPARGAHRNPLYNVALLLQNFPSGVLSSDGLSAQFLPVETGASLLDLRLIAEQNDRGLSVKCEYDTALFDASTIDILLETFQTTLCTFVEAPATLVNDFALSAPLSVQATAARARRQVQTIAVAATFTADPVQDSVLYWLQELEISAKIAFAPYNQVFQQLLDPSSVLNQNRSGLNVLLLRLADWLAPEQGNGHLGQTVSDFLSALKAAAARTAVPWLVCFGAAAVDLAAQETALISQLQNIAGVYVLTAADIQRWYPVPNVFDTAADRLGNVPYTPLFFAALGTAIVRKFHALKRPPRKVIALDCDNTLWDGVCGEDGPNGIRVDAPRKALQEFMRRQANAGMLLCLCTKNNEADIAEVFRCRSDFALRRGDFLAARVNWKPKSENLKSLARELNVGLESFIFVDDNPVECAEVEANCPGVLALRLPDDPAQIPTFLEHAWIFDQLKVTLEDSKRTKLYQENQQREQLRAQSVSMAEFLAGLNLNINIELARPDQFARISQLTQRTNQFNFTTRHYSEPEVQQTAAAPGTKLFAVSVTDRFGEYGLVGVLIARLGSDSLDVDTFLLSCRVLGKGVEHRMLAHLGELAQANNLKRVVLHFRQSPKNRPALDFLEKIAAAFRQSERDSFVFRLPARVAAAIHYEPEELENALSAENSAGNIVVQTELPRQFTNCRSIALQSHDPNWILESVEAWRVTNRTEITTSGPYAAPRTHTERELCAIWASLLGVERVGIHDDFFALGGSSLLAVRLFAQSEKLRALPLVTLFQSPTIEKLAHAIEQRKAHTTPSSIIPIQTSGSRPPIVLVHGAGGGILWGYANLATHLGQDQPVYAIEPRLAAGGSSSLAVEEMARAYLADLRAFQPKGPYYLGGYCFGGYVAYEMARLLEQTNERVALLALIDSAAPNGSYERVPWTQPIFYLRLARNTCFWILDFLSVPPRDQWRFIKRKFAVLGRRLLGRLEKQQHAIDIQKYIDPSLLPEEERQLWQVHLNAGGAYKPQRYGGRITLLRTRGQPILCSFDPQYGWAELAAGGVETRIVPGSHEGIFVEPDVRALAAQLAACIRQARAAVGTT